MDNKFSILNMIFVVLAVMNEIHCLPYLSL